MKSIKSMLGILAISLFCFAANKTERIITGKVTDEKGAAIAGVTVKVCNSKKAVSTNVQGFYSITIDEKTSCLIFSGIALQSQKIAIKESNVIDVKMMFDNSSLDEVIVSVPYGVSYDASYTGSQSTVSAKALSGQVPGLAITNGNGAPGSNSNIRIRGISSISNSTQFSYDNNDEEEPNREGYDKITENGFLSTKQNPLSTFSIDVDAASYSNIRRILNAGTLPPAGAVRIEEMINYFKYNYPQPTNNLPFTINTEQSICPWNHQHQLVLVGLQGKKIEEENLPPTSLTFLIDVSGSMYDANKLPLVKSSLLMLVDKLREQDRVAIVVYAGAAGLVLPSTTAANKEAIKSAIEKLQAGGSTAGGQGIKLAYKTAKENYLKEGNNRVILCTDGDFNVGASSDDELERMIEDERKSGVFLTVLGFGMGNYQDAKMQKLADKGNGNHAYIDGINEAKKVFLNEFGGTLFTIAKDVKFQIEFNPKQVKEYRLIGYENRLLAKEDFNDDKKDAGELGSGHTVTALYEIVPFGSKEDLSTKVDPLRYQEKINIVTDEKKLPEMMSLKLRYKNPDDSISKLIEKIVTKQIIPLETATENLRFAAAVAEFGMLLRNSEYKKNSSYENAKQLATNALGKDMEGYRKEFLALIDKTILLDKTARK